MSGKQESIFDNERKQKPSKLVQDPTTEELKAKREKEKEYALNITKTIQEVREDILSGRDFDTSLEKLFNLEKQTRKVCECFGFSI